LKQGEEVMKGKPKEYTWLLDTYDSIEDVTFNLYYTPEEIHQKLLDIKKYIDPLHLIKWKNLSYIDATWEPFSKFKDNEDKFKDFERFITFRDARARGRSRSRN
jgi:hypothetical protein